MRLRGQSPRKKSRSRSSITCAVYNCEHAADGGDVDRRCRSHAPRPAAQPPPLRRRWRHRTQGTAQAPITCAGAQARPESCLCRRLQSCKNWQQSPAPRPRQHRSESGRVREASFAVRNLCGRQQLWVPRWRPPVWVLRKRGQLRAPGAL